MTELTFQERRTMRIILRYREKIAVATEETVRLLERAGVPEPDAALLQSLTRRPAADTRASGRRE